MQQSNNDKKPSLTWSTPSTNNPTPAAKSQPSASLALPKAVPNTGSTARYIGIFAGGLIFGVVVAWGWSALRSSNSDIATKGKAVATTNTTSTTKTAKNGATNTASVAAGVALESADIDVTSPQRAGQSVIINSVSVSKPTWVVVYDNNAGKPGNVLGAQLFFASTNGIVTLLRPTMAGKTYFIGRAVDNGDRKFQKASDTPLADENGNPILVTFTTN